MQFENVLTDAISAFEKHGKEYEEKSGPMNDTLRKAFRDPFQFLKIDLDSYKRQIEIRRLEELQRDVTQKINQLERRQKDLDKQLSKPILSEYEEGIKKQAHIS